MNRAYKKALGVSKDEFDRMFRRCVPTKGWSHTIGVANSGGPDSTCLLFLLHQCLSDPEIRQREGKGLPQKVVSLTVDHDLQPSSAEMADRCSRIARAIGAEHVTTKINWGDGLYPPRPPPGASFEEVARLGRYHALFEAMTQTGAGVLAFGHHADDQVETSLMRLGRGTTELGAGGMSPCRRWGMGYGSEGDLAWSGYEGMNRWIIRPLLGVGKDRILATCEANNLEYVTDATNFQPHVTLRNAIRYMITSQKTTSEVQAERPQIPSKIVQELQNIEREVSSTGKVQIDLKSGPEQLRNAIGELAVKAEDADNQADSYFRRCTLPSPPGTLLLSSQALSQITGEVVRRALVLRILRFVSFHPWGSLRAQGHRRSESIDQIIRKLWVPDPFLSNTKTFVAGGGVMWIPVVVRKGVIKIPDTSEKYSLERNDSVGWLASRQPPPSQTKLAELRIHNTLHVDLTTKLAMALAEWSRGGSPCLNVLYDCRFLLRFDLQNMPQELRNQLTSHTEGTVVSVMPNTRWYWPKIIWDSETHRIVLHSAINDNSTFAHPTRGPGSWKTRVDLISSSWIHVEWIRTTGSK